MVRLWVGLVRLCGLVWFVYVGWFGSFDVVVDCVPMVAGWLVLKGGFGSWVPHRGAPQEPAVAQGEPGAAVGRGPVS